MKWLIMFDFARHVLEFFFYFITGPLVTIFAYKKLTGRKDTKIKLLELENKVIELEHKNAELSQKNTSLLKS